MKMKFVSGMGCFFNLIFFYQNYFFKINSKKCFETFLCFLLFFFLIKHELHDFINKCKNHFSRILTNKLLIDCILHHFDDLV